MSSDFVVVVAVGGRRIVEIDVDSYAIAALSREHVDMYVCCHGSTPFLSQCIAAIILRVMPSAVL